MSKRKIGDILWLALQYAKSDRISLVEAYGGDKKEEAVRQALADIKAFETLQIKFFGRSKSKLESMLDKMTSKNIYDMLIENREIEISDEENKNVD